MSFEDEVEASFCQIYSVCLCSCQLLILVVNFCLTALVKEETGDFAATFGQHLNSVTGLVLQTAFVAAASVYSNRKSGLSNYRFRPERGIFLPSNTSANSKGKIDFTRGTLLRRTVQRLKHWGQKLSPVKGFAKLVSVFVVCVVAIVYFSFCFGAPLDFPPFDLDKGAADPSTLTFALLLAIHSVLPVLITFGSESLDSTGLVQVFLDRGLDSAKDSADSTSRVARLLFCCAAGPIVGAWAGSIPIPLDWDRPWQAWPVTCSLGCVAGSALAGLVSVFSLKPRMALLGQNTKGKKKL